MTHDQERPKAMADRKVICKATEGADGGGIQAWLNNTVWRLWEDGQIQRTNSRDKFQAPFRDESPPKIIKHTAEDLGLRLWGWRDKGESETSEQAPVALK